MLSTPDQMYYSPKSTNNDNIVSRKIVNIISNVGVGLLAKRLFAMLLSK
jgi:hypothetical protein